MWETVRKVTAKLRRTHLRIIPTRSPWARLTRQALRQPPQQCRHRHLRKVRDVSHLFWSTQARITYVLFNHIQTVVATSIVNYFQELPMSFCRLGIFCYLVFILTSIGLANTFFELPKNLSFYFDCVSNIGANVDNQQKNQIHTAFDMHFKNHGLIVFVRYALTHVSHYSSFVVMWNICKGRWLNVKNSHSHAYSHLEARVYP